jgi:hypothetical protein
MDSSTLFYLAGFFFILGAGIVGLVWILVALVRTASHKGKNSSSDANLAVLARLLRDLTNQELVVEMEGKTYRSVGELSDAQQHRLGIVSGVLVKWLQPQTPVVTPEEPEQPIPAVMPAPAEQPEAIVAPPTDALVAAAISSDLPDQFTGTTPEPQPPMNDWIPAEAVAVAAVDRYTSPFVSEPTPRVEPVSTNIPDVMSGILNPATPPAPAFKSIAMQINDILQEKIAETQFEKRGITLSDGPDGGVLVSLDGKKYSGVKEVPDEEVRSLIRTAVQEWEKHNKAGSK